MFDQSNLKNNLVSSLMNFGHWGDIKQDNIGRDRRELYEISQNSRDCKICHDSKKNTCWDVDENLHGNWDQAICCGEFDLKC